MACTLFRLTPEEALRGVTVNAARALGLRRPRHAGRRPARRLRGLGRRPSRTSSPTGSATIPAGASSSAGARGRRRERRRLHAAPRHARRCCVSVPHVGTEIPADLARALRAARARGRGHRLAPRPPLRASPRDLGASLLVPRFSRYVDRPEPAAREHADVPRRSTTPSCARRASSPASRCTATAARPTTPRSARRVAAYWRPYHDALARRARAAARRARPRDAVRRPQHPGRAAVAVRRPAARPEPRHRRRRQLRAGAARRAGRACWRAQPRFSHVARRPLQGRLHHAPLRPAGRAASTRCSWRCAGAATWTRRRRTTTTRRAPRRCSRCCARWCRRRCDSDAAWPLSQRCSGRRAPGSAARWRDGVLLRVGADGRWAEVDARRRGAPTARDVARRPGAARPGRRAQPRLPARLRRPRRTARRGAATTSGRGATACTASRCASRRSSCARSRRSSTSSCCAGGYTQVCEFHYLQHDLDGSRYADPAAMSQALADAAADAGIGLTLLPVLYERAGFAAPALRADQRRFATGADDVLALRARASRRPAASTPASRSIRCARRGAESIAARWPSGSAGPIHIHVAEQTAEVDDCLAATGCRPIEWLARACAARRALAAGARHPQRAGRDRRRRAHAAPASSLCPSTEANLGDGLADLPGWLAAGVPLAIGSDSQVTRAWPEELRWLEYGQRLAPAPAQRRGGARRRAVDRGAAVRARARRRGRGGRLRALGPAGRRARRPAGARPDAIRRCAACRPTTCSTASSSPRRRGPSRA